MKEGETLIQQPESNLLSKPIATWLLLLANVAIWCAATFSGGTGDRQVLLDFGAMFGPLVAEGDYWRLFTTMFLHVGVEHLAFNCFGLLVFGSLVEKSYGRTRFLLIYFIAGLMGSVASYMFNSVVVAVGASGAIFGVLGALVIFFASQRKILGDSARRNMVGVLILALVNLGYGFTVTGVDNIAHIGGFVVGIVLGFELNPVVNSVDNTATQVVPTKIHRRVGILVVTISILVLGAWFATGTLPENGYTRLYRAEKHYTAKEYHLALTELNKAILVDKLLIEAYLLRSRCQYHLGDNRGALIDLRHLFQIVEVVSVRDSRQQEVVEDALVLLQKLRLE